MKVEGILLNLRTFMHTYIHINIHASTDTNTYFIANKIENIPEIVINPEERR